MGSGDGLSVLHLVTAEEVFFKQQIQTLENKGVDCTVCVVPGADEIDGAMAEKRGIKEYLQYVPKVRRALRSGDFDIIHANYGLTAPYAVTQFKLPVVLTLWGSDVVGFDGLVTKSCAWRADAITVRSEEMKDLLGRDDAYIVPSGVDMDLFRPIDQEVAREKVGWDKDGTYVLFPYSPDYERKNYPLAEAVVNDCESRISNEIIFKTVYNEPIGKIVYYMNAADAVILTSKYEGSPNTVKEAMACNVPVVSSNVGDVKERVMNVKHSGIGNNKEELVDLLSTILLDKNRSNGREYIQDLSWDQVGSNFIDIYTSILTNTNHKMGNNG